MPTAPMDETQRRGNYDSGEDFVLEYGELRFTFNERDFSERCEQAALKLGFVARPPRRDRARGPRQPRRQRRDPGPGLRRSASTSTTAGPSCAAPSDRSLVHWLRRLVFRSRLAGPARQGGRARHRLRRRHAHLRLRPARPRRRGDRALARALLGPRGLRAALAALRTSRARSRAAASPRARRRAPGRSPRRPSRRRAARGAACRWRRGRARGSGRCRRAPRRAR